MSQVKVKSGWKSLIGLQEWTAELDALIQEADEAIDSEDPKPRLRVAAFLTGFIQESAPQSSEMNKLDELARELARDILEGERDRRLAALAARTADYVALKKSFDVSAAEAEASAGAIRLERVTELISSATATISAAREVAESLGEGRATERKISDLIEETTKAIEKLRSAVGTLV